MKTPQGVRKINENVLQEQRALILTDTNKDDYDFNSLPDGTIYIDTTNGNEYIKLKGQTDWVARNVKNDNTIAIMKDSMVINEVFTVKSIDTTNKTFVYTTDTDQQMTGKIDGSGHLVFSLNKGTYLPGRNHLNVKIDGILERTVEYGNLVEVNESSFFVVDELQVGHVLVVSYIKWIRIGNPYPRCFMSTDEPTSSEIGDLWIDTDAFINSDGDIEDGDNENIPNGQKTNWNNIINTPTTLNGYGIVDAAPKYHTHTVSDITDFPKTMKANGGNADTVGGHSPGTRAGNVLLLDINGRIPVSTLPEEGLFYHGMIMDWYGKSNEVPNGWHICDGTNGTPDLRDKFIIAAGGKYEFLSSGGEETHTLTEQELALHGHNGSASQTNITGDFRCRSNTFYGKGADSVLGNGVTTKGVFSVKQSGLRSEGNADDNRTEYICHLDASHSHNITTTNAGGNKPHNNMPPYIALFKIMKL